MEIVPIFDGSLYTVLWDNESENELERLFDLWNDTQYLFNFFSCFRTDLQTEIWGDISIDDAVLKTIHEAEILEQKLINLSGKQSTKQKEGLESLFAPLIDSKFQRGLLSKSKAKKGWLRIYGIRLNRDIYIITGGAIKLTAKMEERRHTKKELVKLEKCRNYLLEKRITEIEGMTEEFEI